MSEQTSQNAPVSETEVYLAELEAVEAEADAFLAEADPQGQDRGLALTRQMRKTLKRYSKQIDRIRQEAMASARQELIRERQTEAGFRRLNVPQSARALFGDVDPTDLEAMQQRADELRQAGLSWPGQPQPAPPPPPDPTVAAVQQMQMAQAGGMGGPEPWDSKLRRVAADPGAFSDQERDDVVDQYNQAVTRAGMPHSSGALG
jgi:hypothetical protein